MQILITGTSKGLGSGLASYYLGKGYSVYGISRTRNDKLENYSGFYYLSCDLSDFEEMSRIIPGFLKKAGKLDLVILNAGVLSEIKDLKDCSLEEIKKVMDINLWSNKILIDLLFSNLNTVTQIVAISSGASVYGNRGWNAYSLSKAALNMLIKLYSGEQPETHFSAIAPGLVDSSMQDYIYSLPDDPRFPSIEKLKKSKGTSLMPGPSEAAIILANSIEKALNEKSGIFLDVREM